jgi:hypothetical protein
MLVGGDKAGNWTKWYTENIPAGVEKFIDHQDRIQKTLRKKKR